MAKIIRGMEIKYGTKSTMLVNGQIYHIRAVNNDKKNAVADAEYYRKQGYNARIKRYKPSGKGVWYAVYTCERKDLKKHDHMWLDAER